MFCRRCGMELLPEHKFCKNCGTAVGAVGDAQSVPAVAAAPTAQYGAAPQQPPPGMVAVMYQAYPGGPQQLYYMPASQMHPQTHQSMMEGLRTCLITRCMNA